MMGEFVSTQSLVRLMLWSVNHCCLVLPNHLLTSPALCTFPLIVYSSFPAHPPPRLSMRLTPLRRAEILWRLISTMSVIRRAMLGSSRVHQKSPCICVRLSTVAKDRVHELQQRPPDTRIAARHSRRRRQRPPQVRLLISFRSPHRPRKIHSKLGIAIFATFEILQVYLRLQGIPVSFAVCLVRPHRTR